MQVNIIYLDRRYFILLSFLQSIYFNYRNNILSLQSAVVRSGGIIFILPNTHKNLVMVVRLRLQRFGRKHSPFYRMVAADARAPRDGRFLEIVSRLICIAFVQIVYMVRGIVCDVLTKTYYIPSQ